MEHLRLRPKTYHFSQLPDSPTNIDSRHLSQEIKFLVYPMASRSSKRLRTPAASATVAINGTAARSSTGVRAASKRGKQSGGRGRGRPPISHVPGFSQGMSSAYLHDFTTAMVGAASADTVLAAVKRLEPSDAEARRRARSLKPSKEGSRAWMD